MTPAAAAPTVSELRARVTQMQGRPAVQPVRTHPALSGLLQMQTGSSYGVESASLAMMLLAGPSSDGAWCGVVGSADRNGSELGLEAMASAGVELSRTILVPDPGDAWLEVTAALIDVLGVVVVRPPGRVSESDAARLAARLRQRGSILVALSTSGAGEWPRCDARLGLSDVEWIGLGDGHGHLRARQATVEVRRGVGPPDSARLWLPDTELVFRAIDEEPTSLRSVS
ncbi:hypothetical protein [Aeromicrobium sp.]|uniref:hypothetical protein n=1 Tax=Aeromicrobium sp. TaxID=1871063 RepID=UPI003C4B2F19